MQIATRDGRVVFIDDPLNGFRARAAEQGDERACKCCAFECDLELEITVSFCGMTATETLAVPGILNSQEVTQLPDGSFIILSASVSCTPCGWVVEIGICAYCESTQQFASDAFTASVPFAQNAEPDGTYCPESGPVDLTCFGAQFGIPCVTDTTAQII